MAPRRLPNGRFAKVVQLPDAKGPRVKPISGGTIIVSTSAADARKDISEMRRRVPAGLQSDAEERAKRIQARIRTAMTLEYPQGTGRAARGIYAKVTKSKDANSEGSTIRVTSLNYREMEFITNLGGKGYFKSFPVQGYRIYARGVEENIVDVNSETGESFIRKAKLRRGAGSNSVGRLKVPRPGRFFTTERRSSGPAESREINDVLGTMDPGDRASAFFYYPLWVNHPGFTRDVISDIVLEEGGRFVSETTEVVRRGHIDIAGEEITTDKGSYKVANMTVSDEIPLTSITLTRGKLSSR